MDEPKTKLKVYCETSFWSYLNGGRTALQHIAMNQAVTLQWWQEVAPSCDIFISDFVDIETGRGDRTFAELRRQSFSGAKRLDGTIPQIESLAAALLRGHAVPLTETTDASHIATAAVYGMDVLLTWNCRHLANPVTLPRTAGLIAKAGFHCPVIITPGEFLARKEEFGHAD